MKSFSEYYKDLLEWEGVDVQELITKWDSNLIAEIITDFEQSISASSLKGSLCQIREKSSNQSIGNQVEVFAIEKLNQQLQVFTIENCSGAGYPDRILTKDTFRHIALEFKATSDWNPSDSNRRVLTSSSKKLRNKFVLPIYHLLCTVIYLIEGESARVAAVRLDFIEPTTQVSVRLEASVNHKTLAGGDHQIIVF